MSYGGDLIKSVETLAIDQRLFPLHDGLVHPITIDKREKVYLYPNTPNLIDSNQNILFTIEADTRCGIDLSGSYFVHRPVSLVKMYFSLI